MWEWTINKNKRKTANNIKDTQMCVVKTCIIESLVKKRKDMLYMWIYVKSIYSPLLKSFVWCVI